MARSRCLLPIVAFVASAAVGSWTTHAAAQSAGYAVNRFEPSERGSDWYASESLDLRGRARPFAGVVTDWAYRPLVLRPQGRSDAAVITDDVMLHVGGGLNFGDRFRAAVSLPLALYRHGEDQDVAAIAVAARAPEGEVSVSDLRFAFNAGLLGDYGGARAPRDRRAGLPADRVARGIHGRRHGAPRAANSLCR